MTKEERKIVEKFFAHYPPCHAIPRANEALAIRTVKLNPPILDLGCGDGKFALFTFGRKQIQVGLDKNRKEVAKAEKSGAYKEVVVANASKMPFQDESFGSIIANSVLEHVDGLGAVLGETHRVLKNGGSLVLTVPTPLVSRYQFWDFLPGYVNLKTKLWKHFNYFEAGEWQERLEKAGFRVERVAKTNSRRAIMRADIFFPLFWLGPMPWAASFLEKRNIFGPAPDGATLIITCGKEK